MTRASRLARIVLTVADLARAERFYTGALGFARVADGPRVLRLGSQDVELAKLEAHGAPYPVGSTSADLWFHHFAVVVSDMERAWRHVAAQPGFAPISRGGPQRLPPAAGSVTAFKFRDPDGHPLELLHFPVGSVPQAWREARGLFLGIDHTAIAVSDAERSIAFYGERLGLHVSGRSLNRGEEQSRLDDLPDPFVEVVALSTDPPTKPHLELLAYREPRGRPFAPDAAPQDIAATRLVFEARGAPRAALLRDPDGHLLMVQAAPVSRASPSDGPPRAARSR